MKCSSIMGCFPFMDFSAIEFAAEILFEITAKTLQAWRS
jgi:hypothetical protein